MEWKNELELALSMARDCGPTAVEIGAGNFEVQHKARDSSPVTEADRKLNERIVSAIERTFPDDRIVAEESRNPSPGNAERCWFIDPIDGTKDFVQRNGEWSIMIGFAHRGTPALGVIYQAQLDKLYWGVAGEGAYLRDGSGQSQIRARSETRSSELRMAGSRNHPDPRIEALRSELGIHTSYAHGSVGLKAAHIAEGRADVYFNFSGKCGMWDVCAADALLRAAGGAIYRMNGEPVSYAGASPSVPTAFIASSEAMKQPIVDVLARHPELDPTLNRA